jgi:aspartyl-tRNA(Asn)/glutamyl-tRNA(Gln) amidotransferase subunit A
MSALSELIRTKKVSPVEITRACLKRIELLNPKLNAFITVTTEQALREAKIAETEIKNGRWKGQLHGIPVALKDNIDTAGIRTTAASGVFKNRVPTEDAEVVKQLKKAGAVIIGKTNLHEFALGTTSHISYFGAVRNPWNTDYIPGGSSGGSAAAVAVGMCYAAIGTDTGGSNRLPAACCGITGFKPSFGLISTRGIIPAIQSVDHAGVFSRSVQDAALVLNAIASSPFEKNCRPDFTGLTSAKNFSIGVVQNFKASDEVNAVFNKAVNIFQASGNKTEKAEMPVVPASVNFGESEIETYHRLLKEQFKNDYDPVTLKDISTLKEINTEEYIRQRMQMEEDRAAISDKHFRKIDVLILPTTAAATPTIEEAKVTGPFALDPSNTDWVNYYGLPAISIPCGFDSIGMPLGLQIVGPRGGEQKVIEVANLYQQKTKWYLQHPKVKI